MKKHLLILLGLLPLVVSADDLKAAFVADKAYTTYYSEGFDSEEDFASWTVKPTNKDYIWHLTSDYNDNDFASIDGASKMSLAIDYARGDVQDETVTSPEVAVKKGSTVEFYNWFNPVWLYEASWTFSVTDVATGETEDLLNQFKWANTVGYDETKWTRFAFPLDKYEGKTVKFAFRYKGNGGDSQLIDGFRVMSLDDNATAKVNILEGETINFIDQSEGSPEKYKWEFDGGTPAVSTLSSPSVTYDKAGTYSVKLTVSRGEESSSAVREGYVVVRQDKPNALIGMPLEGYLSPYVASFVPTGVPVKFRDLSTGKPSAWKWTFKGGTPETSEEQNPEVVYNKKGTYSLSLEASNEAGTDTDMMLYALQAGGAQYVWNLEVGESDLLQKVSLGWYGNYAGTNWLGITAFAEKFGKPLATATVDSVDVFFASNTTVTPDADITLSLRSVGADGKPDAVLASTSVKAADIKYTDETWEATRFKFDTPAQIDGEFFVVVEGFPNNTDEETNATDDLAIACVRREPGQKTTTWQLVEDQDEDGNPLGTSRWFENTDDPVSMAVCPVVTYDKPDVSDGVQTLEKQPEQLRDGRIYNLQGIRVKALEKGSVYIKSGKKFIAK